MSRFTLTNHLKFVNCFVFIEFSLVQHTNIWIKKKNIVRYFSRCTNTSSVDISSRETSALVRPDTFPSMVTTAWVILSPGPYMLGTLCRVDRLFYFQNFTHKERACTALKRYLQLIFKSLYKQCKFNHDLKWRLFNVSSSEHDFDAMLKCIVTYFWHA